jgi:ubiquinone/menaquinone biosynthesis C-methylase UbiE
MLGYYGEFVSSLHEDERSHNKTPKELDGLGTIARVVEEAPHSVPSYLERHYWWAYVHPNAVRVFERQWLVNLILWGNFDRLRDAALGRLGDSIFGRTLQVACVYGDLTQRLVERLAEEACLDVVDILPVQLENLARKLGSAPRATLELRDSADLKGADGYYDQVLVFFLLHEQPLETRRKTVAEALRVTKPGGRVLFVDYHRPHAANPMRLIMKPVLRLLEPFALDLWNDEISAWLPEGTPGLQVEKQTFFGGLYQMTEVTRT